MINPVKSIIERLLETAVSLRSAEIHISGQAPTFLDTVMCIHLFGDTQTRMHWRKELYNVALIVMRNSRPSGKLMKLSDMHEALRAVSDPRDIENTYRGTLQDDSYSKLVPRRRTHPTTDQMKHLVDTLVSSARSGVRTGWEIADDLLATIDSWS